MVLVVRNVGMTSVAQMPLAGAFSQGNSGPQKKVKTSRPLAPKAAIKKIPGALSVFRWTVKHLYLTDTFQGTLSSANQISLYAFYKQATVGPNELQEPADT